MSPIPSPEAVVQSFYDWWLDRSGDPDMDYTTRAELSDQFIAELKAAAGEPFAIEPFLCVQDGPVERVQIAKATISGDSATVTITFSLAGRLLSRQIELGLDPAGWRITAVRCDLT